MSPHLLNFRTLVFFLISQYTDLLKKVGQLFWRYNSTLRICLHVCLWYYLPCSSISYSSCKPDFRSKGLITSQSSIFGLEYNSVALCHALQHMAAPLVVTLWWTTGSACDSSQIHDRVIFASQCPEDSLWGGWESISNAGDEGFIPTGN